MHTCTTHTRAQELNVPLRPFPTERSVMLYNQCRAHVVRACLPARPPAHSPASHRPSRLPCLTTLLLTPHTLPHAP